MKYPVKIDIPLHVIKPMRFDNVRLCASMVITDKVITVRKFRQSLQYFSRYSTDDAMLDLIAWLS